MKVSLLCFDLAHNCLGRTHLLADVLSRRHQVEILGTLFARHGGRIWAPCDDGRFTIESVEGGKMPGFLRTMRRLQRRIRGDVVYACKPRLSSFGVGLLHRALGRGRKLLLDVDDEEMAWFSERDLRRRRKQLRDPLGPLYTRAMVRRAARADGITTVSKSLQRKYGGVIVPHGRDPRVLDPALYDGPAERRRRGIPEGPLAVFLGTPRPHKGLEELVDAIARSDVPNLRLLVVGRGADPVYDSALAERGGDRVLLADPVPFAEIAAVLSMADVVALPQRDEAGTRGQVPAKLFDAMAMARPIVVTAIGDLPEIVEDAGYVVPAGDVDALAAALTEIFADRAEAERRGAAARRKLEAEYSHDVMASRLEALLESLS